MIKLPKLILASQSPRRAEILTAVGWEFEKQTADIDETELPNEKPADYVRRLSRRKAEAIAERHENALVLGADTIVVINDKIIGKPKDFEDARRILRMLSGNWHEVLTGVAIVRKSEAGVPELRGEENSQSAIRNPQSLVGLQRTSVKFAEMNESEIEYLVEKGDPLDKAGAYAVQAQAALFIEKIEGDYWNVVGLPINLVYRLITKEKRRD
jgi:septum formation protein